MIARHEIMHPGFYKWHVPEGCILHRFTGPDHQFHDHPFCIDIQVLSGGYVEEVLDPGTLAIERVLRQSGDCFTIAATHIHRIPQLLVAECWTVARYGPWQQEPGFWRVTNGRAERRVWDEQWQEAA